MRRPLSPSSLRVLDLLRAAGAPVKAYDLLSQLETGRLAKPPTVYRALNQLVEEGLAHRILSLDAFTACRLPDQPHQPQFMICGTCGRTTEAAVASEQLEELRRTSPEFHPTAAVIELTGICEDCR